MIDDFWNYVEDKTPINIPLRHLHNALQMDYYGLPHTLENTLETYKRIQESELEYPIIIRAAHKREENVCLDYSKVLDYSKAPLFPDLPLPYIKKYIVVDGTHRIAKAMLLGWSNIRAIVLTYAEYEKIAYK